MPAEGDYPLPNTHLITIEGYDPETRFFRFEGGWGQGWGDGGKGYLPYDYFDKFMFECWVQYMEKLPVQEKTTIVNKFKHIRWIARDHWHRRIYGFEIFGKARNRLGWSFLVEKDDGLEVEELYVRPEFRRRGHGRWLAEQVIKTARAKGSKIRLWVPFADTRDESPSNFEALTSVVQHMDLTFRQCAVQWAAYMASNEATSESVSSLPIERTWMPGRPTSALSKIFANVAVATNMTPGSFSSMQVETSKLESQIIPGGVTAGEHVGETDDPEARREIEKLAPSNDRLRALIGSFQPPPGTFDDEETPY